MRLRQRFFGVQGEVAGGVDDVPHDSVTVDHICHARRDAPLFVEDSPDFAGFAPGEVAEQGEAEAEFAGVRAGGEGRIDAEAQHLGAGRLELRVEFLEAAQFVRSTTGEGEHVPGDDDGLAAVVAQAVLAAVAVHQGEVRRLLFNFDGHDPLRSWFCGSRLYGTPPAWGRCSEIFSVVQSLEYLLLEALPLEMPSELEVDVSGLSEFGSSVLVRDITLPEGVRAMADEAVAIATVLAPRLVEADEEEDAEGVEAEAAPADAEAPDESAAPSES